MRRALTICAVWGCPRPAVSRDGRCLDHARRGGSRWRRLATNVVSRAGGRCERCGRQAPLSAHHRRVLVVTGADELVPEDQLLALCVSCQAVLRPTTPPSRPNHG